MSYTSNFNINNLLMEVITYWRSNAGNLIFNEWTKWLWFYLEDKIPYEHYRWYQEEFQKLETKTYNKGLTVGQAVKEIEIQYLGFKMPKLPTEWPNPEDQVDWSKVKTQK